MVSAEEYCETGSGKAAKCLGKVLFKAAGAHILSLLNGLLFLSVGVNFTAEQSVAEKN